MRGRRVTARSSAILSPLTSSPTPPLTLNSPRTSSHPTSSPHPPGADTEARDSAHGNTPLIVAALGGHQETARLLCEAGADVTATNRSVSSTTSSSPVLPLPPSPPPLTSSSLYLLPPTSHISPHLLLLTTLRYGMSAPLAPTRDSLSSGPDALYFACKREVQGDTGPDALYFAAARGDVLQVPRFPSSSHLLCSPLLLLLTSSAARAPGAAAARRQRGCRQPGRCMQGRSMQGRCMQGRCEGDAGEVQGRCEGDDASARRMPQQGDWSRVSHHRCSRTPLKRLSNASHL